MSSRIGRDAATRRRRRRRGSAARRRAEASFFTVVARGPALGLTVKLEDERGRALDQIEDPTNILHRLLPSVADANYHYISMIDWYGDTVFNYLQAPRFIGEWLTIAAKA